MADPPVIPTGSGAASAPETAPAPLPTLKVTKPRRLSIIWLAPVFAALAVGYLVYDVLSERGPMIYVTFSNAQGVIERKTPLKFEGVEVGVIEDLDVDFATGAITFHIRLRADSAAIAREGSQFWIQNPKISLTGVRDLDTLISGPYVACLAGRGKSATRFKGLSNSPPALVYRPGLRVSLHADELGAVEIGSAVLYRGLNVGTVEQVGLSEDRQQVTLNLFIEHAYASLVRSDTAFWEVSGLQVDVDLDRGLRLDTRNLRRVLTGAIAFRSPDTPSDTGRVSNGTVFALQRDPSLTLTDPSSPDDASHAGNPGVRQMASSLSELVGRANLTLERASDLLEPKGPFDRTLTELTGMSTELGAAAHEVNVLADHLKERKTLDRLGGLLAELEEAAPGLKKAIAELSQTLGDIDGLVKTNNLPLTETILAARRMATQLEALLEDIRANPSQILSKPPSHRVPQSNP